MAIARAGRTLSIDERIDLLIVKNPSLAGTVIKSQEHLRELEQEQEKRDAEQKQYEKSAVTVLPLIEANSDAEHAMMLFFRYVPIVAISQQTGIPTDTIKKWVYGDGGWLQQRDEAKKEISEAAKQGSLAKLRVINNKALALIEMALKALLQQHIDADSAPNLLEADKIAQLWERIHGGKIAEEREQVGDELASLSPMEILRAFASDPYLRPALDSQRELPEPDAAPDDLDDGNIKTNDSLANPRR